MSERLVPPRYTGAPELGEIEAWAHSAGLWPLMGTDEVGRGPLAGPVVAAAVVLPDDAALHGTGLLGLNDSKLLSESKRESLVPLIERLALAWHVEPAWQQEIAERNILGASLGAMQRACAQVVRQLGERGHGPVALLVIDGNKELRTWAHGQQVAVIKGDRRSRAVAAAAVLAKVWRDHHMAQLEEQYPGYGFAQHKGYPTADHLAALARLGPSAVHRRDFGPVRALSGQGQLWLDG